MRAAAPRRASVPPVGGGGAPERRGNARRPIRVAMLTRYSPLGASSRYRSYQYLPYLEAEGLEVLAAPLFDDRYLQRRYSTRSKPALDTVHAVLRRAADLAAARDYDVLFFEKELVPMLPYAAERHLIRARAWVIDLDDAVFHNYDLSGSPLKRRLLGTKIDRLMGAATLTVAGNAYLARRAVAAGCGWVEVLPSVVDLDHYGAAGQRPPREPAQAPEHPAPFTVGWIGTPFTAGYLDLIRPALVRLAAEAPLRLMVIGDPGFRMPGVEVDARPWSAETEVADLCECHAGVMPLADSPFERGKCGLKLIQYMACRKPVVASPVGVNRRLVKSGANGFLAGTEEEWVTGLRTLRDGAELRRRMGEAGRAAVEREYALQVTGPRLAALIREAAERGRR